MSTMCRHHAASRALVIIHGLDPGRLCQNERSSLATEGVGAFR